MAVQIEFGDKTRTLKFPIRAIRELEQELDGKPLGVVISNIGRMGIDTAIKALFHGLKHEDKSLSINLVEKMFEKHLETGALSTLTNALIEALNETGLFRSETDQGNAPTEQAKT